MKRVYRLDIPPLANSHWMDVVAAPLFTPQECEAIVALLDDAAWTAAGLVDYEANVEKFDQKVRSAALQNLPLDGWPVGRLMNALSEVNAAAHRFSLTGLDPSDPPSVVRYEAGANDHFRPHKDVGGRNPTRKLTFVVQLTDPDTYTGGDLVFPELGQSAPRAQGTLIVFPSFQVHVVSPVVEGVRYAIVSWLHGPTFT